MMRVRTRHLVAPLLSLAVVWMQPRACTAQLVFLSSDPGSRAVSVDYAAFAGLVVASEPYSDSDGESYDDSNDDGSIVAGGAEAHIDGAYRGYIDIAVDSEAWMDDSNNYYPMAGTYATILLDTSVDSSALGSLYANAHGNAYSYYTLLVNGAQPSAGISENSATLHAELHLQITGDFDDGAAANDGNSYGGSVGAGAASGWNYSWVEITPLDSTGEYWSAQGTLTQSSSSSPSASPLEVDDTLSYPIEESYYPTVATNVGATTSVSSLVSIYDSIYVGTDAGPMTEYPLSSFDERQYSSYATYHVTVP